MIKLFKAQAHETHAEACKKAFKDSLSYKDVLDIVSKVAENGEFSAHIAAGVHADVIKKLRAHKFTVECGRDGSVNVAWWNRL